VFGVCSEFVGDRFVGFSGEGVTGRGRGRHGLVLERGMQGKGEFVVKNEIVVKFPHEVGSEQVSGPHFILRHVTTSITGFLRVDWRYRHSNSLAEQSTARVLCHCFSSTV
jgi:hypothetical protein